jgi:hypothetical protein
MFASVSSDTAICLRCQLRLLRRQRPRTQPVIRRTHSSPSFESHPLPQETPWEEQKPSTPDDIFYHRPAALRTLKGREIKRLDQNTLGKPTEVLIIQHEDHKSKTKESGDLEIKEGSHLDIPTLSIEEITQGQRPASDEEAHKLLDDYRKSWPGRGITEAQWIEIRAQLKDGFTAQQLSSYLSEHSTKERRTSSSVPTKPEPGAVNSSKWKEGQTPFFGQTSDDLDNTPSIKSLTGKEMLADRIMRRCWQFHRTDTIGELYMHLHPRDLNVLLRNDKFLKALVQKWDLRLDLSRSRNVVRVSATSRSCYLFRVDVEAFVMGIESMFFTLPTQDVPWVRDLTLRDIFFDSASESTGTVVEHKRTGETLAVTIVYSANRKNDADRAAMHVLSAFQPQLTPYEMFLVPKNAQGDQAWWYPMDFTSVLWIDNQKKWSRILVPPSSNHPKSPSLPDWERDMIGVERLLTESNLNEDFAPHSAVNAKFIRQEAYAMACHILHESGVENFEALSPRWDFDYSARRTLSTDTPGSLPFLRSKASYDNDSQHRRLLLTPSPLESPDLPPVEILFGANDPYRNTKQMFIASMSAIIEERVADVLLPNLAVDLRLTKRVYFDLINAAPEPFDGDAFMISKGFSNKPNGNVYTQRPIPLDIPTHLLHRFKDPNHGDIKNISPSQSVTVKYLPTSMDRPEPLLFNMSDMVLQYRKVFSSIRGGNRKEIELSSRSINHLDPRNIDEHGNYKYGKFFSVALKMAQGLSVAAESGQRPTGKVVGKLPWSCDGKDSQVGDP